MMGKENILKKIFLWKITVLIFVCSIFVRFIVGNYIKAISVYQDELIYLHISRSLFESGRILIRGENSDFQKILYPLLIAPANFFRNKEWQLTVITLLNCIYMSSAVIPMLLIARKFFRKNWQIILALITTVLMPTISMTMTFMSENTYFPLCFWTFYSCISVMEETRKKYKIMGSVLAGALNYLLYLNKEVAVSFFIAYLLIMGWEAWADKSIRKLNICGLAISIFVFCFCNFFMGLTVFNKMENGYQMSIAAISINEFKYMLYAVLYNGLFALIAFFVLPIVLPFMRWRYLDNLEKRTFAYACISLGIIILVVSYLISIKESFGQEATRQHLRYFEPLFPIFFILFLSELTKHTDQMCLGKWEKYLLLIPVVLSVLIVLIPKYIERGSIVDGFMLRYYELAQDILGNRLVVLRMFIAFLVIIVSVITYARNRIVVTVLLIMGIWGICIVNNVAVYVRLVESYKVSPELLGDWYELNSFMEERDGNLLVIMRDWYEDEAKILDTFLEAEADYLAEGNVEIIKEKLSEMKKYSYLLVCPSRKIEEGINREIMKVGGYTLYEVSDSKEINIVENPCFPKNNDEKRTVSALEGKFCTQFGMKEGRYSYISGRNEGFLINGPYTQIYPGTYDITVYYEYEGEMDANLVVGIMDLKYEDKVPEKYVEMKAESNKAELKNIVVEELYNSGEIRIYTTVPKVRFIKAEIYRH